MKQNSIKLILNSNLCLFESLRTKFKCFSCTESFLKMSDLRNHSKIHMNSKDLEKKIKRLRGMSYKKVDISGLLCNKCEQACTDLEELKHHLSEKHNLKFGEAEHFLIPYKVENDYQCVICKDQFSSFLRLTIHMNCHYKNNVCEICGVSFINRMNLRLHLRLVHKENKCSICPATFLKQHSKYQHMKKFHNGSVSKRYCLNCNKTFLYTYQLYEHQIKEHGVKRPVSKCNECGKSFLTPQNLKIHMRSVHMRERNYPCSLCDMRFFTKCDQRRHARTHEDIKAFKCNFCDVKFKTKDSMRRHLRRLHGFVK